MSGLWVGVTSALAGVVVGSLLSTVLTWWRDKRRTGHQKRLLAGALAQELQAFAGVLPKDENEVVGWAVEQSYTSVYDSAGQRLYLLGSALLAEVAACYFAVKRALDSLHRAQLMTRDWQMNEYLWQGKLNKDGRTHATQAREAAVAASDKAIEQIEGVVPKLVAVTKD